MVYNIPHTMTKYEKLLKSNKNILNIDDFMAIWQESDRRLVLESIKGYAKRGKLINLFKGIYSLKSEYNPFELGQKLFTPSYISYYTALAYNGVIFQKYDDIHLFATNSKRITVNKNTYIYHKININILLNAKGIVNIDNFSIASPERSICDSLYINKDVAFDNLNNIDRNELISISKIYTKRVQNDVINLVKNIV
jgi:predicted transcriptional regulator of viral defense system